MKWFAALMLVCLPAVSLAQSAPQEDAVISRLVDSVLRDAATLHPGMTRRAVNALFIEDGGLQFFAQTRYDYRRCRSIKIDVKFKSANVGSGSMREERANDIITEISRPYLEYPFAD